MSLRILHGVAILLGIQMSVLMLLGLPTGDHSTTVVVFALNLGLIATQLFVAWCAWCRFNTTSFRTAALSFIAWLVFFVWQGWLPPAPWFRKQEYLTGATFADDLPRMTVIALWTMAYLIFPILCYKRRDGRNNLRRIA